MVLKVVPILSRSSQKACVCANRACYVPHSSRWGTRVKLAPDDSDCNPSYRSLLQRTLGRSFLMNSAKPPPYAAKINKTRTGNHRRCGSPMIVCAQTNTIRMPCKTPRLPNEREKPCDLGLGRCN